MTAQEVVKHHLKGIKTGDKAMLEKVWDKEAARIIEINQSGTRVVDVEKAFKTWTQEKNPSLNGKIVSVTEVTPVTTVVKVTLSFKGYEYTDMLTLIRTSPSKPWKLVGKIFKAPLPAIGSVIPSSYG